MSNGLTVIQTDGAIRVTRRRVHAGDGLSEPCPWLCSPIRQNSKSSAALPPTPNGKHRFRVDHASKSPEAQVNVGFTERSVNCILGQRIDEPTILTRAMGLVPRAFDDPRARGLGSGGQPQREVSAANPQAERWRGGWGDE